jgi:hypothetical protein
VTTNVVLGVLSAAILCGAFAFGRARWNRLDVVDLYVLSYALSFGAYTLADVLVNDVHWADSALAGWSLVFATMTTAITWMTAQVLPPEIRKCLRLSYFIENWKDVSTYNSIVLVFGSVAFLTFGFFKYNVFLFLIDPRITDVSSVPYWFSSLNPLIMTALMAATTVSFVRLQSGTRKTKFICTLSISVAVLLLALYGRRNIGYTVGLMGIIWFYRRAHNPFSCWGLTVLAATLPAFFLFSNVYQSYRGFLNPLGILSLIEATEEIPSLDETFYDSSVTLSNLEERPALWHLNYLIHEQQSQRSIVALPYGEFLIQAFLNSIPKLLYESKHYVHLEDATADFYGITAMDHASSFAAHIHADWGYFSILLTPLFFFLISLLAGVLIKASSGHPALTWMLSVFTIVFFINIETDYTDLIVIIRNLLALFFGYCILSALMRWLKASARHLHQRLSVAETSGRGVAV